MILALVQARMGSTRLPGKSMALIEGVPLIEHVIRRVQASKYVTDVCVCTTIEPADNDLAEHVDGMGVDVHRGSEDDVLSRFYWASQAYPDANPIVRITGDDIFKDPELIDYALTGFLQAWAEPEEGAGECHYMLLGGVTGGWPLGLDVEVFSRQALEQAHRAAHTPEDREHVTPWMAVHFNAWMLKNPHDHGNVNMRWTIDTPDDLAFAREVYAKLYEDDNTFGYDTMREAGY